MTLTRRAQQMRDYLRGNEEKRVEYKVVLADLDDDLYVEYLAVPGRLRANSTTNFFDLDGDGNSFNVSAPLESFRSQAEIYDRRNDPLPKELDIPDDRLAMMMDRVSAFIGDGDPEDSPARALMADMAKEESRRLVVKSHGEFLAAVETEHQREAAEDRKKAEQAEADRVRAQHEQALKTHAEAFCADLREWARVTYPLAGVEKFTYRLNLPSVGYVFVNQPEVYYRFELEDGRSVRFDDSDPEGLKQKLYDYQHQAEQAAVVAAMTPEERALADLEAEGIAGELDYPAEGDPFTQLITSDGEPLCSAGKLTVVFGPSEAAKSWLAALWAVQVASGGGWCIWLGYESDSGELMRRLGVLGLDDDGQSRVRWRTLAFELRDDGDGNMKRAAYDHRLIRDIERIRAAGLPVVVVVDSFSAMLSKINGSQSASNDDQAVSAGYHQVRSLITDDGVSVCQIDHGDGELPRGSKRKKEEADLMYQLKMHGSIARDGYSALTVRKAARNSSRFASGDTVAYLSAPDNEFVLTSTAPRTSAQKAYSEAREYVLDKMRATLAANPDINDSDLWRAIPSSTKRREVAADRARLISSVRGE